ncbi:MAG: protein TolR [Chromatiales bacterium]|jgi:biopolymer transport protein TolR|nr:protein TolR [Chromatiales bacterium]
MATPYNKRRLMGEINVVPYIDVMLVLLIIFMVTAPLLTQGIDVDLPKVGADPLDTPDREPLVLTVDAAGSLYLNVGSDEDEPVDAATVVARTAAVLQRAADTPVLVKADQAVAHGIVVGAMRLLQQAGAPSVGIMTDPEQQTEVVRE